MKYMNLITLYLLSIFSQQLITSEKEVCHDQQSIHFNDLSKRSKKDIGIPSQGAGKLVRMPHMREILQDGSGIRTLIISKIQDGTEIK